MGQCGESYAQGGFCLVSDSLADSCVVNKQTEKEGTECHVEPRSRNGRLAGNDMFWEA